MKGPTKAELDTLGVTPRKSRGQNFLVDPGARGEILEFLGLGEDELILEIGPGLGAITPELIKASKHYLGVEVEEGLFNNLVEKFSARFINQDILKSEIPEELKPAKVIGNIPYSISTGVLTWLLGERGSLSAAYFLLQKEFAERVAAKPGTREVSSLGVLLQFYFTLELGPVIAGDKFHPKARVDSRMLSLLPHNESPVGQKVDQKKLEKVLRSLFSQRRKTILNSLSSGVFSKLEKESLHSKLEEIEVDSGVRVEKLELEDFYNITCICD